MKLIYLVGAGRSGTTILATLLGNAENVINLGELHQMPEHSSGEKNCSCGKSLQRCKYWNTLKLTRNHIFSSLTYKKQAFELESHSRIFKYFFDRKRALKHKEYCDANLQLFQEFDNKEIIVDSAKYIGRALSLAALPKVKVHYIYLVRDPRGVVNSFAKNVQTSRNWLSASIYYLTINSIAEIVSRTILKRSTVKIRYEDLLANPDIELKKLGKYLGTDLSQTIEAIQKDLELKTGHIIGGNRFVSKTRIKFNSNESWPTKMPRLKKLVVWFITLPLNIINRYY